MTRGSSGWRIRAADGGHATPHRRHAHGASLLALYALGFALTHSLAATWGGDGYYSLWFPAAGLRLALLWRAGARFTAPVALVELAIDLATGAIRLHAADWAMTILGVVRPVVGYGLVVVAVRRMSARAAAAGSALFVAPMPFALASMLAPIAAALLALPQALWRPDLTGVGSTQDVVLSLAAFIIGDLLGVLLLAPPLLWIADRLAGRRAGPIARPSPLAVVEAAGVLTIAVAIGATLHWAGLGREPAPALMAIVWIGLRLGRLGAWAALLVIAAIALPLTAGPMETAQRLSLHFGLATIVVTGYLAGSYADAQAHARGDLARRDRLLFQAERLKTLRAMSVAVIHEISQPLSTLSIEARHLRDLTASGDVEIAAAAALIDTKAAHLSELVRRLRRYGGRAVDDPTLLPLGLLIDTVVALAGPEVHAAGAELTVDCVAADLVVLGQEVELAQAVVNLIRNAAQACGAGGRVSLAATRMNRKGIDTGVELIVSNHTASGAEAHSGMGVGTLIARAIVEAHGGTVSRSVDATGTVHARITLPLIGEPA